MGSGTQRQPDLEGCAAAADTVHGDSSTLPCDECPANRQSQTDAWRLHLAGGTSPVEPLEELGYLVLRDSRTRIAHGDHSRASLYRDADRDLTAQGRELDRVVQDVRDDMTHRGRGNVHRQLGWEIHDQRHVSAKSVRGHPL